MNFLIDEEPLGAVLAGLVRPAEAGDVEDLQTAFERRLKFLEAKDLGGFLGSFHPEAVIFTPNRIYPIDRAKLEPRVWAGMFAEFFDKVISVGRMKQAVEYRVVGDTGMVWGLTRLAVDAKYGEGFDQDTRLTVTFVRGDGDW